MFKISVNTSHSVEIAEDKGQLLLNNQPLQWDVQTLTGHSYHILRNDQSYTAELLHTDYVKKEFTIKINGTIYQLQIQDDMDLLLEKLGMGNSASAKIKELKAPMPGMLLDIRVKEGQSVQKGDVLLILEAMKMENAIKAVADGIVKLVKASKGQSVEKNQLLLVFE